MSKKILINGCLAYDLLLSYEGDFTSAIDPNALDNLSISFFSPHSKRIRGGTSGNIAWNLKLLGSNPLLLGATGNDGLPYLNAFNEAGIDTTHIGIDNNQLTATAIIGTDQHEHQIAFFHPGADSTVDWPDLSAVKDNISYAISSPRDMEMMKKGIMWPSENSIPVLFDPGQQVISFSANNLQQMIKQSTGVIANEYEWSVLQEKTDLDTQSILEHIEYLIVTKGEHGASYYSTQEQIDVAACKADRVVNPTGAGDALRAGFLHGITHDWNIEESLQLGCCIASFVVEAQETQLTDVSQEQLAKRWQCGYSNAIPEILQT